MTSLIPPLWNRKDIHFERLTSPEIQEALKLGWRSVVFACGAIEQHGPHITLSMDASHGTALAEAVARKLGKALVAPTIRVGCSEHHMAFPGTLSLRRQTFQAVVADHVRSLARHGFRRIYIIPTHGGNFEPLQDLVPKLQEVAGVALHIDAAVDLMGVMETWARVAEDEFGLGSGVGGHADVAEGSIMMALHPDRVRMDRLQPGLEGPLSDETRQRLFKEGMKAVSPNGVLGDPRGMNAALGRLLIQALSERIAEKFRERLEAKTAGEDAPGPEDDTPGPQEDTPTEPGAPATPEAGDA